MKRETSSEEMNTISECIRNAVKTGYTHDFFITEEGLSYSGAGKIYIPGEVTIKNFYRFEGESDPADNAILYLMRTTDGVRGTLLDAYGPYAEARITRFVKEVSDIQKQAPHIKMKLGQYLKIGLGVIITVGTLAGLLYKKRGHRMHGLTAG
ncbi:hypothetical protein LQ567_02180 [Niabella pedocola]|uniref:Uncharacterized protein n=1 Tax=Niabella pedocola TaxID=1752077 RepID=A0ABS8PP23_9BACT|nr:hypothetical protein [Niabella pedocola]MCD2421551.1 hypothetical protein [Niabella pedocola]